MTGTEAVHLALLTVIIVLCGYRVGALARHGRQLSALQRKVDDLMAKELDVEQLVKDIDTATNAVAAKLDAEQAQIKALQAQIAAGTPVTQAQLDSIAAGLQAQKDRLTALGANPANPVPA